MQGSQDDIDFSGVAGAIMRGLPRIVGITALVGLLCYGVLSLVPPSYKSTAQVILETPSSSLLRPSGQVSGGEVKIDESEVASQAEVLRSRDLLSKVVTSEHLDQIAEFNPALHSASLLGRISGLFSASPNGADASERALAILAVNLRVGEVPKTRLINIDVTAHDAKLAASIANAIAQAYLDRNRASQVKDASDATTSLGVSVSQVKQETEAAEAALERFRAESGLLSGQNNVTLNNQQLSELNTQLTQATAARTEAEARSRILREMITGGNVETSQEVVKSPNMQQLFQQKLRIERDIAELSATLLPGHPRMRQLATQLVLANESLRQEAKQVAIGIEDDLKVAAARQQALESSIAQLTRNAAKSSDAQAKLGSLEREAQSKRNSYDSLLQRMSEASSRRNNASVSAMASLNESAVAASVPDSPKKTQMSVFAMLGAALLSLVTVIARELLGGGTRSPKPQETAKAAISSPQKVGDGAGATAEVSTPQRLGDTSALVSYLGNPPHHGAAGRVLLTGEIDGQDVIPVACELAGLFPATDGALVVVDLTGRPAGTGNGAGFAELVSGTATFEDVVKSQSQRHWHLIEAGGNVREMISGGSANNIVAVLDALGAIYRTVLIAADRPTATTLLEALQGQIDLGVVSASPGRSAGAPVENGFLGYDVADLKVIWLDGAQPAARSLFGRSRPPRLAASPA